MRADQVLDALSRRWPAAEYLMIPEAPRDADRGGERIDALVISLWNSRGFEREAVEIKVSYSDWKREHERAAKADFWWRHTHRFWIACPADLAPRILPELPTGWGLLAVEAERTRVAKKPERHDAEPLPAPTMIGVMRASAGAGIAALDRARREGVREAEARLAERPAGHDAQRWKMLHDQLASSIKRFEEASGVDISRPWENDQIGEAVALVLAEINRPGWAMEALSRNASAVISNAEALAAEARRLQALAQKLADALPEAQRLAALPLFAVEATP